MKIHYYPGFVHAYSKDKTCLSEKDGAMEVSLKKANSLQRAAIVIVTCLAVGIFIASALGFMDGLVMLIAMAASIVTVLVFRFTVYPNLRNPRLIVTPKEILLKKFLPLSSVEKITASDFIEILICRDMHGFSSSASWQMYSLAVQPKQSKAVYLVSIYDDSISAPATLLKIADFMSKAFGRPVRTFDSRPSFGGPSAYK